MTVGTPVTTTTTVPPTTVPTTTVTTVVTTTAPTTAPTTLAPTTAPTISGLPVADFALTTPSAMGIQIIDASANADSVRYDLGDGTSTAYRNFRYIYWQVGTYTITLTATNAAGSSVKTVQVTVPVTALVTPTPTPVVTPTVTGTGASFTALPVTSTHGDAVKFTVTPALGKTIQSNWWTFDKVNHYGTWNSRDINPTFFYPKKGDYTILVKITYTDGTTETVERASYIKSLWASRSI
ncbi:PKD domain-containing protein [Methanosphaerula subterraneus]|uniref:PKD domain-containing protein n=1 Tax=Methanosphaerula subterraneus TaxID=3350244 RepID=UPI003F876075